MKNNLAVMLKDAADPLTMVHRIVEACEDVKGKDVAVLDVRRVSDVSDYFIVVSARSDRQVQGLTNRVIEQLSHLDVHPISVEGYEDAQWVLMDFGDVVVHVFYEPVRDFYDLESLWMRAKRLDIPSGHATHSR